MCHWNTAVLERTVFPFNSSHPQPPGVFRPCLCTFVCWSVFVTAIVLLYLKLLRHSFSSVQSLRRRSLADGRYMTAGLPDWSETCWLAIRPFSKWDCKVLWFTLSSGLLLFKCLPTIYCMSGQFHKENIFFATSPPFPPISILENCLFNLWMLLWFELHKTMEAHFYLKAISHNCDFLVWISFFL